MSIFQKTQGLKVVEMMHKFNLYPYFRKLEGTSGNNVVFKGKELVMMGSNNYLGLTHHPEVIKAGQEALAHWGTGCTGSRFLNGNLALHEELEERLAKFLGYESALVFASGFMANQGAISTMTAKNEYVFSDEENHACIIEGCRLTKAEIIVYKHNDMDDLENKLKSVPAESNKLIITDGVFSMTGHIAKLDKIVELAKTYNAQTYVDDAHGLGTIGEGGRGTGSHFGLKADIFMGTFSKSLASQGGVICGNRETIEWIKHTARTFMFSAALSPSNAAIALKALDVLEKNPSLIQSVKENAQYLQKGLNDLGLDTFGTETCIVPVMIGPDQLALTICQQLLELGVFTTPVLYPAVPKGHALIRCSVMASHTKEELDHAIKAFGQMVPMITAAKNQNEKGQTFADLLQAGSNLDGIKL